MKFEQELVLNSVPEWRDHYLNYEQLKRLIYIIEQGDEAVRVTSLTVAVDSGETLRLSQGTMDGAAEPLLSAPHNSAKAAAAVQTEIEFESQVKHHGQLLR
jgi:hypothetical protein